MSVKHGFKAQRFKMSAFENKSQKFGTSKNSQGTSHSPLKSEIRGLLQRIISQKKEKKIRLRTKYKSLPVKMQEPRLVKRTDGYIVTMNDVHKPE
eukprot:CAMPEP_0197017594 /NCGR_PEP_ID=MMETSP1380-20130617/79631_1 /TAXON_ID=5936 /ORGANISM="Euplotes crassus, Strain CT5" /LENGTH=94 /DNA_ID=CAMNT_0042444717 /DNA_START=704 /DNA_END=988 /DNA_ORIENTATION=+